MDQQENREVVLRDLDLAQISILFTALLYWIFSGSLVETLAQVMSLLGSYVVLCSTYSGLFGIEFGHSSQLFAFYILQGYSASTGLVMSSLWKKARKIRFFKEDTPRQTAYTFRKSLLMVITQYVLWICCSLTVLVQSSYIPLKALGLTVAISFCALILSQLVLVMCGILTRHRYFRCNLFKNCKY